tara:strand:- start:1688 stop:1900 length:213 start_codon:yes stop_codon:yes gene_type:complete
MPLLRRGADCGVANAIWKGRRMTDFEKQVDSEIRKWYLNRVGTSWDKLFDEQRQLIAEMYWRETRKESKQ